MCVCKCGFQQAVNIQNVKGFHVAYHRYCCSFHNKYVFPIFFRYLSPPVCCFIIYFLSLFRFLFELKCLCTLKLETMLNVVCVFPFNARNNEIFAEKSFSRNNSNNNNNGNSKNRWKSVQLYFALLNPKQWWCRRRMLSFYSFFSLVFSISVSYSFTFSLLFSVFFCIDESKFEAMIKSGHFLANHSRKKKKKTQQLRP